MKLFLIPLCLLAIISCNNTNQQRTEDSAHTIHTNVQQSAIDTTAEPFILSGCYQMTLKKDSATLRLTVTDTLVNGRLVYDWNEKDGNVGTIKGVLKDSLIMADYTFESEGLMSVREVVFKIENESLWPAFGPLTEQNGKIIFQNKAQLQYDSVHPFIKVACTPAF